MNRQRALTGLKPTGRLQLGNLLGALEPATELAKDPDLDAIVMVADLHALTVEHDPTLLRQRTLELAATSVALGCRTFVQSSLPAHAELHYLLESTATFGEVSRMVQFKEKSGGQDSVRLSLLTYPVLMAADVVLHRSDLVPVGSDQAQHLELTRTLAERVNKRAGRGVLVVPRAHHAATPRVKDLRDPSAKMGKTGASSAGVVFLDDPADVIAAKVKRAVTDPDPDLTFDPELRPGVANLASVLGALTGTAPEAALKGLHGSGQLKAALTEVLFARLVTLTRARDELLGDPTELKVHLRRTRDVLAPGAVSTLRAVREATGLLDV